MPFIHLAHGVSYDAANEGADTTVRGRSATRLLLLRLLDRLTEPDAAAHCDAPWLPRRIVDALVEALPRRRDLEVPLRRC